MLRSDPDSDEIDSQRDARMLMEAHEIPSKGARISQRVLYNAGRLASGGTTVAQIYGSEIFAFGRRSMPAHFRKIREGRGQASIQRCQEISGKTSLYLRPYLSHV